VVVVAVRRQDPSEKLAADRDVSETLRFRRACPGQLLTYNDTHDKESVMTTNMRYLLALPVLGALLIPPSVLAQGALETFGKEIELSRSALQTQRKALVAENLGVTEQENPEFWSVYDDYRTAMTKPGDRQVKLITDYADAYVSGKLTDEEAKRFVKEFLSLQSDALKIRKRYVMKFSKVLSPKKVMRLYQIENKFDAIVNAELSQQIPLVE